MRKLLGFFVTILLWTSCDSSRKTRDTVMAMDDPNSFVDPNIGTAHSRWFFYTPAAVPFGMAKLSPSTNGSFGNAHGWDAVGYDSRHSTIEGFANLHEFQIGGFLFGAMTGELKTIPGPMDKPDQGYRSRFDRADEVTTPGYYSVILKDYDIKAELTATKRVGFHKYTFPKSEKSYILFDIGNELGESGDVKDAYVSYNKEKNNIEGWVVTYPKYVQKYQPEGEIQMFFYAELSQRPDSFGTFRGSEKHPGESKITGEGAGAYLRFNTKKKSEVVIKAGFSYTSLDNARLNLKEEAENLTFEEASKQAEQIWRKELGKIQIKDSSKVNKTKFYTGLFHALLGRGVANDVNGDFPQNDGTIGHIPLDEDGIPSFSFYNTDSVWGAFWNLTQLWTLVWPEYYNDFIQSHLTVYKNSGWLGDGLANSKFVSGVGTNFVGLIIASAYQAGIRDYDVELAFNAAYENETLYKDRNPGAGKLDLGTFLKQGYVTQIEGMETTPKGSGFSASHTLEYSFSSYAVAQFAKSLGKQEKYNELIELSKNWENLYDEQTDFIRPKDKNGNYLDNFDPFEPWKGFQEGNAWQYTFYVPHTPKVLIDKMGEERFVNRLDSIFTVSEKTKFGGEKIDAFAGLNYLYNQGNQPNLHIAYLFNFTDYPWLSQKWVHKICNGFYGTEPIHGYGYGQDEDQGQLGAWYVMSSIGLFDVKGLTSTEPSFQLVSPMFDEIIIKNGWGGEIRITSERSNPNDYYIQSLKVDGKNYHNKILPLDLLKKGVTLEYVLGKEPNKEWFE